MYKNKPGPRLSAKSVKNPSLSLNLFFTDKMVDNVVQYTNMSMQPVIEKFPDPLDGSTKYSQVKLVDRIDIETFIGILYLRAVVTITFFYTIYLFDLF